LQTPGMMLGRNDEYERYVAFLRSPGITPLHLALLCNKPFYVTKLICSRLEQVLQQLLVAKTFENENALNIAIRRELHPQIIELLIDKKETVLCTGQVDDPVAGSLVDLPVQVILKRNGEIPFDMMEKYCKLLLGFKNSVLNKQNSKLETPLHTAFHTDILFERYPHVILQMLNTPPQVYMAVCTMQDSYGNTPLHLATSLLMSPSAWSKNNAETYKAYSSVRQKIMERLSVHGAVLVQNNNGDCALHMAIEAHAQRDTLTLALFRPLCLIDRPHNQVLLKQDMHGATPLHLAVRLGCVDIDLLQWLTDQDELVLLKRDETKALPLHTAIEVRQTTPNQLMFLSGTKDAKLWNVRNSRGHIPLCAALYNGADWGIVRFMLFLIRTDQERMLALQSVDRHDRTPLQIAMRCNAVPSVVNMLLRSAQGLLTIADDRGDLPLHLLFRQECAILHQPGIDYVECVSSFIDHDKKSLVRQNKDGNTPLHLFLSAIPREMAKYCECVMALLKADSSIFNLRNNKGQTIFNIDLAFSDGIQNTSEEIYELKQYGNSLYIGHH